MLKSHLLPASLLVGAVLIGPVYAQVVPRPLPKGKDAPRVNRKPVAPAPAPADVKDDVKKDAKDRAEDAKDRTKDRVKDAGDDAKDRTKDRVKDAGDDAKDRTKDRVKDDAKDRTKDRVKDAGDDVKDAKDRNKKQARKFDAEKVKVDDLGLTFKDADKGFSITNINKNSVFVDAGFQNGDQIVSINGQNVARQNDFVRYLFAPDVVRVGRVPVIVIRGGARETVYLQPATIIRNYETVVYQGRSNPVREFGLVVDGRSDDRVYVERVIKDSRADLAGIQVDDEILAVNEQPVETSKDLSRLLEKHENERLEMEISRDREAKLIEVKIVR